jgi:hypothetical protein
MEGVIGPIELDESVINALFFEPGEEKVPPFVGRHRTRNASLGRIASQHLAHAPIRVLVLAHRLKEVDGPLCLHLSYMQSEQFAKGARKGNLTVLAPFPLRNANLATLDIDFIEANRHQLADPDTRVEEGFDQHHIRKVAAIPDRLVEAAYVLLLFESIHFAFLTYITHLTCGFNMSVTLPRIW